MRQFIPEVLLILARAQQALGQVEAGCESLAQGRAEAEKLGARWDQWQILSALSELERARGNARAAETYREEAQGIIAYIAKRLPQPSLRESFLATAHVRKVIGGGQYVGV